MNFQNKIIEAELTYINHNLLSGIQIEINEEGKIKNVGPKLTKNPHIKLHGQAIFPGMINCHSHAFHRGLRRRSMPVHVGNNFWSWRDGMYDDVMDMTRESMYKVCRLAFQEMVDSGITSVGEFHYLHHDVADNQDYLLDSVVLDAARDVGIRIVLLETLYKTAGIEEYNIELTPAQKKFESKSLESFWHQIEQLKSICGPEQSIGVAVHSVRAVDMENITKVHEKAAAECMPFHIHLEEQPNEIQDCLKVHNRTPSELLLDNLHLSHTDTVVHSTYTKPAHLMDMLRRGVNVCVCPLTEGRLGDGVFPFPQHCEHKDLHICIGTDCNNRICMSEEMRWFLYAQQMKNNHQGLVATEPTKSAAELLFQFSTENGGVSLGLDKCGKFAVGNWMDAFTVDFNHPNFHETNPSTILDAFIFGTSSESVIKMTCVSGVVRNTKFRIGKSSIVPKELKLFEIPVSHHPIVDSSCLLFLESIMKIDSTTGKEGMYASLLQEWFTKRNWKVQRQQLPDNPERFNLLVMRQIADPLKGPKVLLCTHLDTVPPFIPPEIRECGAILHGRGSSDAKGVMAAMIWAAESLPDADVGLLLLVGEEKDHIGAIHANELHLVPDAIICGEPTELKLASGQKGIIKFDLQVHGRAAHSGYPHRGESATDLLLDCLSLIKNLKFYDDPVFGKTTINIGLVSGGNAHNIVPATASAGISFRITSDPETLLQKIKNILATYKGKIQMVNIMKNAPMKLDTLEGFDCKPVAFNTDLPYLKFSHDHKKYLFGPGSIQVAHGPNEFISNKDLITGVEKYKQMIQCSLKK